MQVDAEIEMELLLRRGRLSQSLISGLALLGCFTAERPSRGIADLAAELGMGRSTTHRYATTLVELGFLERDRRRRYRLGLRGADVGLSLLQSMRIRERCLPYLEQLRSRSRCATAMAVLDGADALCVLWLPGYKVGWRSLNESLHVGARAPAHTSSLGKALLALEPEGVYAGGEGKSANRACSIAAAIENKGERTSAAIGLLAPASAHSAQELAGEFGPSLLDTAAGIASELAGASGNGDNGARSGALPGRWPS